MLCDAQVQLVDLRQGQAESEALLQQYQQRETEDQERIRKLVQVVRKVESGQYGRPDDDDGDGDDDDVEDKIERDTECLRNMYLPSARDDMLMEKVSERERCTYHTFCACVLSLPYVIFNVWGCSCVVTDRLSRKAL